jgi:hypothetical protein
MSVLFMLRRRSLACLRFNVEGDASLIVIVGKPVKVLFRIRDILIKGSEIPGWVTPGRFHLDDIRAQVSQDLPAEKTHLVAEIENAAITEQLDFLIHRLISPFGVSGGDVESGKTLPSVRHTVMKRPGGIATQSAETSRCPRAVDPFVQNAPD